MIEGSDQQTIATKATRRLMVVAVTAKTKSSRSGLILSLSLFSQFDLQGRQPMA
jgi:hypothetical protein